jgi:hypothetical protein
MHASFTRASNKTDVGELGAAARRAHLDRLVAASELAGLYGIQPSRTALALRDEQTGALPQPAG